VKAATDYPAGGVPRVLYTDLDGTLLGPGGSLFAGADGVTRGAAEAVAALHEAGVILVPTSGRTASQLRESARILGANDFIAELGGLTYYDLGKEIVRNYGAFRGRGTPYEAMARSGAAAVLLGAFPGRLEPHAPWAFENRECSMLFRGLLDEATARAVLDDGGHSWLDLRDNGIIRRTFEGLVLPEIHAYHLVPAGVDKASAVRADLERRGLRKEQAVAVGDAPSDAALSGVVGAVFIVANGRENVERSGSWPDGVYATQGPSGDGFAEATLTILGA
jgi:hypothetical protein